MGQYRAINTIINCMLGEAEKVCQIEAVQGWAAHRAASVESEYNRLYGKFQRAMLTAQKYNWDTGKCIQHGRRVEAEISSQNVSADMAADVALNSVIAVIKEEKLLAQKQYRAINTIINCMLG